MRLARLDVGRRRKPAWPPGLSAGSASRDAVDGCPRQATSPRRPFSGAGVVTVSAVTMTDLLPERLLGPDQLVLRRWVAEDVEIVGRAVRESLEHLRPWMPWVSEEPLSPEDRTRMIREWEREWLRGGDVYMGVFLRGRIAGGCGLHYRIGAGGLEIGYWTHPAFIRRGVATKAAGLLTDAALARPGITHVEIHHDKANRTSAGVPRKLGYQLVGEAPKSRLRRPKSGSRASGG